MMRSLMLLLCLASAANAQRNCNIASQSFDSPVSFGTRGGWRMMRVGWHGLAMGEAVVVAEGSHKVGLSRRVAGMIVPALSLAIHTIGVSTHRYRFNPRDWLFDVVVRSLPLAFSRPTIGLPVYAAAYASTVCWSSP